MAISLDDIKTARETIAPYIHITPVFRSRQLDEQVGASLFFKAEHLQKTGAFKARGATNAVFCLSESEASQGVATHSSGNHGAALARAAQLRGISAHIVVPANAKQVKKAAIEFYGGIVVECEPNLAAREETVARLVTETGAKLVPPYDDERIICGQGTLALELIEQVEGLQSVVIPVGGGGLLAGCATVLKAKNDLLVYGAEPEGADDAYRSFHSGVRVASHVPDTIADGLLTTLGETNFEIIRHKVDDILLVSEAQIIEAMTLIWTRMKQVIEPSSAVTLAAVMRYPALFRSRQVALVLTGGNVDLTDLPF